MDGEDGRPGGAETDIRSLFYWSRSSFYILVAAGALWIALGAWKLYVGLVWLDHDTTTGSTQAESDIAWGIAYCAAAVIAFLLARLIRNDVVAIFSTRRFTVQREKLLVYSVLALPFGFILPGVLLILVNVKLSNPEFLPSHAEAYPEAMPGFVMIPSAPPPGEVPPEEVAVPEETPRELAPLGFEAVPVSEEEAQPAPEFMGELPPEMLMAPGTAPGAAAPAAPMAAYVEEVLEEVPEEGIPEVVATVVPPVPSAPPAAAPPAAPPAIIEEVPAEEVPPVEALPEDAEATFEEVVEEEADFELVLEEVPPGEAEMADRPKDTKEAHDQLMAKLLGK